jgi:hypothetical protein
MGPQRGSSDWFRKAAAVLTAGWYSFATTGFFVVPSHTTPVASVDSPCATHSCDCRTAEQCVSSCCCIPAEIEIDAGCPMHVVASESIDVSVTVFAVGRCTGSSDDGAAFPGHRIGPHEPSLASAGEQVTAEARWTTMEPRVPSPPDVDAPDKIPISLSRSSYRTTGANYQSLPSFVAAARAHRASLVGYIHVHRFCVLTGACQP